MPSLIDLLKDKGVSFPDGFELGDVLNSSEEVQGLVKTKNELLDWKNTNKPLLETLTLESEANAKAAQQALEEKKNLALKNNDLQAYLDAEKEAKTKAEGLLQASREGIRNAKHDQGLSSLSNLFGGGVLGNSLAAQLVNTSIDDEGNVKQVFKLNDVEFSDFEAFKIEAEKDKEYGKFIQTKQSNSPAFNGQFTSQTQSNVNKAAEEAKAKGDLAGFLNATIKL